jgi:opacity protein-like surface antigen
MKSVPLVASLAVLMAATSGAASVQAQPADANSAGQQQDYQRQQDQYRGAQSDYQNQTEDYRAKQDAYQRDRARFERERSEYDARYGAGAFERYYREHREEYDNHYGRGAYDRDFAERREGDERRADNDYYRDYRASPCEQRQRDRAVAGTVIGALAGAALGSNLARGGGRVGGTVIGAVLGGVVGSNIARSTAQCDNGGYYFSYDQTYPYREGEWERGRSGRYDYDYYSRHGCRLAVAPAHFGDSDEYRYVRVCPDDHHRYRIAE